MTAIPTVPCDKCLREVAPVLTDGEDFTHAACPHCAQDLTLVWYAAQQMQGPMRFVRWLIPIGVCLGLVYACSR